MGYVIYCNIIIHIIIIHYPAGDIITLDNDDMDILYIYITHMMDHILMLTFIKGVYWWDPWHTINIAAPWIRHGMIIHHEHIVSTSVNVNLNL